jgi:hypothetical protein
MTNEQLLIEECSKFALYVANQDADAWNSLCRDLTSIWKENTGEERIFDFLGFDRCHKTVGGMFGNYFHAYCLDELKNLFYQHSRAVIALASQEILFRIKAELELGNYYE